MRRWWHRLFVQDHTAQDERLERAKEEGRQAMQELERSTQRLFEKLDRAELKVSKK